MVIIKFIIFTIITNTTKFATVKNKIDAVNECKKFLMKIKLFIYIFWALFS